jgi:diguanylate cyclase (GGDEF)-like protein/PAS domain S-box-containing protein
MSADATRSGGDLVDLAHRRRGRGADTSPVAKTGPELSDGFHKTVVDNLFDGVYYVDRSRRITYWNRGAERISGYSSAEVVGAKCFDEILRHVDDRGCRLCVAQCPLVAAMAGRRPVEKAIFLHHRDGHRVPVHVRVAPILDPDGTVVGAVEIFSEDFAIRRAREEIEWLRRASQLDPVTGLRNRRALELSIRSRLRDVVESGWPLGLLFVDVDRFKDVNDGYGHDAGDRVLSTIGSTLTHALRPSDVVGRWGGDEFVALAPVLEPASLEALAERVRMLVETSSTPVGEADVLVTVSVGATVATPGDTLESTVARGDAAMYEAKRLGRNRVTVRRAVPLAAGPLPARAASQT